MQASTVLLHSQCHKTIISSARVCHRFSLMQKKTTQLLKFKIPPPVSTSSPVCAKNAATRLPRQKV